MRNQDIFVGRDKELHMIDEILRDPTGARHLVRMIGQAGIGKTWLLREIYQRYRHDPGVLVVRIDYGESRPQSLPGLSLHVIEQFGDYMSEQQKADYHERMAEWDTLLQSEIDPDKIRAEQNKIYHFGIDLIWQISQERRTLVLSDAVDTENALEDIQRTNLLATNLPNTIMILAGRPTPFTNRLYEEFEELYKRWTTHPILELSPFSHSETTAYLDGSLEATLPTTTSDSVFFFTKGHPVLTTVTTEWLAEHKTLPDHLNHSLAEIETLPEEQQIANTNEFEATLVSDICQQETLLQRALLYLSHLNRRYDPQILKVVLDIEDEETLAQLIGEIHQHPFVRKSVLTEAGLLHEQVERLFLNHVWPKVDPDGTFRKSLARKIINFYYLAEVDRLSTIVQEKLARSLKPTLATAEHREKLPIPDEYWPKRDLQMECLYYHFYISEEEGWKYLNHLFDDALTYHYSLIQMDAIVQAVHRLAPNQVDSARFQARMAQILLEKGELKRAAEIADSAVESSDIHPADAAKAFIVLANTTTDPAEKVIHFKVALEMAEAAEDPVLELKIQNNLGLAYRRQGHWNEAEQAYLKVLYLLDEQQDPNQYAATLNNLSFVYMLNGNAIRADNLAEKALRMRREQGNIHGLGFSYSTRGRIAESMGNYVLALRYHHTAVDLCELVGDTNNAALMQINVAAAECYAQRFETAHLLLSRALRSELPNIRARGLQQAATIYMEEARALTGQGASPIEVTSKYENAEKASLQALELTKEILDDHLMAGVLLDLVTIAFLKDGKRDEQRWQELESILQDHNYKLEKGRLRELEGDIAFQQEAYTSAFDCYLDACETLADYSVANFRRSFEQLRDKFFDASNKVQREVCRTIRQRYADIDPSSPLMAIRELCVDVIVRFESSEAESVASRIG